MLTPSLAIADDTTIDYNIIVRQNGDSLVIITLNGTGLVSIPLPLDAKPVVKGAVYLTSENGIDVQLGEIPAAIAYKTSLYTAKTNNWIFDAQLSNKTTNAVVVMPSGAEVLDTSPKAGIITDKYLKINFGATERATITYRFAGEEKASINTYQILFFILLALAVVLTIVLLVIKKRPVKQDHHAEKESGNDREGPEKKSSQHNIVKTLSRNEQVIIKTLTDNNGEMKRNELERLSKLSKSSLAASLNSLERKNIVKIDKSQTVHYVELTDWFKSL